MIMMMMMMMMSLVVRKESVAWPLRAMAGVLLGLSLLIPVVSQSRSESRTVPATSWESGVRLDGSRTSYARFSTWSICRNASLSFEFRTRRPTALLVYADDDDGRRFVELRLVRGRLRLRYRLATSSMRRGDSLTSVGYGLDDGRWHAVRLRSSDGRRLVVTVDGASDSPAGQRVVARPGAGTVRLTTGTFVGGLPASVRRRPMDLAVPTVAFDRPLDGSVRRFQRSLCSATSSTAGAETVAALEAGRGTTPVHAGRRPEDGCATANPCLHDGVCVNTAAGPLCECDRTEYDGMRCSIGLSRVRIIFVWSPYVIRQTNIFSPCDLYLLSSSSSFFLASTILPHMVWP